MSIFIDNLEPIFRQFLYLILIIFFMAFLVRPLLHYLAVNREIEHKKRLIKQLHESMRPLDVDDASQAEMPPPAGNDQSTGMAVGSAEHAGDMAQKNAA
jgi:uncharacterized membrane protein